MDFNVQLSNGQFLKGIIQTSGENHRGVILLVHGIGEHSARYAHWIDLFKQQNFTFVSLDLPGHGRSDGKRGSIKSFSVIHEMIGLLIKTVGRTFPGVPLYLYGHSMGGGMVLEYAVRFNPAIKGVIATSPWLKLSFQPPAIKVAAGMIAARVFPGFVQPSGLNTAYLSHDHSIADVYNADPLVHDKISAGLFAGAMAAAKYSLGHAQDLKIPALIVHGNEDMICSPEGSREFASRSAVTELKIWDGGYHELHNEPFKQEIFSYILDWIIKQEHRRK